MSKERRFQWDVAIVAGSFVTLFAMLIYGQEKRYQDMLSVTQDLSHFTPGAVTPKVTIEPLPTLTEEPYLCIIPVDNMRVRNFPSLTNSTVFAQIEEGTEHRVLENVLNSEGEWVRIEFADQKGLETFVRPVADANGNITAYVAMKIDDFEYFGEPVPCSVDYLETR